MNMSACRRIRTKEQLDDDDDYGKVFLPSLMLGDNDFYEAI